MMTPLTLFRFMDIALWVVQIMLAGMFFMAGTMKLVSKKAELEKKMGWAKDFSGNQVKLIGTLEVLGAVGLILPMAIDVLPVFTAYAAIGLMLTMAGAAFVHLRRREPQFIVVNVVLFAMAAFVAYGRLMM